MAMIIYSDPARGNVLTVERRPRRSLYKTTVHGWYGGAFYAANDTEALDTFKRILREEATI